LKKLEKQLFNFIWNGKRDFIKRKTLIGDIVEGGINMI
jgi:hypothetical protein